MRRLSGGLRRAGYSHPRHYAFLSLERGQGDYPSAPVAEGSGLSLQRSATDTSVPPSAADGGGPREGPQTRVEGRSGNPPAPANPSISQWFVNQDNFVIRKPRLLPEHQHRIADPCRPRAVLAFPGFHAGIVLPQPDIVCYRRDIPHPP